MRSAARPEATNADHSDICQLGAALAESCVAAGLTQGRASNTLVEEAIDAAGGCSTAQRGWPTR